MTDLNSREGMLAAVRALRAEIERVGAATGDGRRTRPGGETEWTVEDVIAHLTSWRLTTAARLEAASSGTEPTMPWPASLDEERDLDEINRWFFAENRDKPLATIVEESRQSFQRVERALAALPEHDLFAPDRFPWLHGEALGPAVIGGTIEHHHEHAAELRA